MLEQIRAALRAALEGRASAQDALDAIVNAAAEEKRTALTADEETALTEARAKLDAADAEIEAFQLRVAELEGVEARKAAAEKLAADLPPVQTGKATVRVGSEPTTYRKGGEHSFLSDAFNARFGSDYDAAARLARHGKEMSVEYRGKYGVETRDVGTSAFAGLVVPQYLTDMYAPLARAGRPFADRVRHLDLPADGMTVNISRITTGSAVAAQASQNATVQETDMDDTLLTVNVNTIAGMQDVSIQASQRGTMVDEVVVADLVLAYHTELNRQCIAADGTSGTHLGVLSTSGIVAVTYTDASPTVPEVYPKIADGIQQIAAGRYLPPDLIVMAPRRAGWFTAALDSSNRPLVVPQAVAMNPAGTNEGPGYGSTILNLQGLPAITDGSVPTNLGAGTNEDRIIITRAQESVLWEEPGTPLRLRFEEVLGHQLSIRFVVYGFSAFTAGRYPLASAVISGTGLVTPTF